MFDWTIHGRGSYIATNITQRIHPSITRHTQSSMSSEVTVNSCSCEATMHTLTHLSTIHTLVINTDQCSMSTLLSEKSHLMRNLITITYHLACTRTGGQSVCGDDQDRYNVFWAHDFVELLQIGSQMDDTSLPVNVIISASLITSHGVQSWTGFVGIWM